MRPKMAREHKKARTSPWMNGPARSTIPPGAAPVGKEIPFPGLTLCDPATGQPNRNNVATHVALTGKTINIEAFKTTAD